MKRLLWLAAAAVVLFVGLQCIHPGIPTAPETAPIQVPVYVSAVLQKDCYSCHSNQARLSWFDQVAPAYWLVRKDILVAREHLNFSTLGSKPAAMQRASLFEAFNMMQLGAMPLPRFTQLHPDAKVSSEDLATLKAYLQPWATLPPLATATAASGHADLTKVAPEFNGIQLDPAFESWSLLSATDRGDNGSFRFILGNQSAMDAARTGNISPWPDGARFAKVAWQQALGSDGLIHPGSFIQVEIMSKDGQGHRETEGWNWGRWRGMDLKPYGTDAHFVTECTTCHLPMRGDDYVYTLPVSTAKVATAKAAQQEVINFRAARLPPTLPYQPLTWRPITMYVDPAKHTLSVLFGNDVASAAARSATGTTVQYPAGAVLALVTWQQREDPHWFGARIPDVPASVEFVAVQPDQKTAYRMFEGDDLHGRTSGSEQTQRVQALLQLAPLSMP